jgi:hypothetical protein
VAGVPLIVGAGVVTVIEKLGSEALLVPSLTEITMFEVVPALASCGVPESWPVLVLRLAQVGLPEIEKVSVLPLGFVVVGVKLYAAPAVTEVAGEPLIVGGGLPPPELAITAIVKAGSEAAEFPAPMLTVITMLE